MFLDNDIYAPVLANKIKDIVKKERDCVYVFYHEFRC